PSRSSGCHRSRGSRFHPERRCPLVRQGDSTTMPSGVESSYFAEILRFKAYVGVRAFPPSQCDPAFWLTKERESACRPVDRCVNLVGLWFAPASTGGRHRKRI